MLHSKAHVISLKFSEAFPPEVFSLTFVSLIVSTQWLSSVQVIVQRGAHFSRRLTHIELW